MLGFILAGILIVAWMLFLELREEIFDFLDVDNDNLPEWLRLPEKEKPVQTPRWEKATPAKKKKDIWE